MEATVVEAGGRLSASERRLRAARRALLGPSRRPPGHRGPGSRRSRASPLPARGQGLWTARARFPLRVETGRRLQRDTNIPSGKVLLVVDWLEVFFVVRDQMVRDRNQLFFR